MKTKKAKQKEMHKMQSGMMMPDSEMKKKKKKKSKK